MEQQPVAAVNGVVQLRLAESTDIPGILDMMEKFGGSAVKVRSHADVEEMVHQGSSIIGMSGDRVVGTCEAKVFTDGQAIHDFFKKEFKHHYPYQEADVVVFVGGMVHDPSNTGWAAASTGFFEEQWGAKLRSFQSDPFRRIVYAYGTLGPEVNQKLLDYLKSLWEGIMGGEPSYVKSLPVVEDGTQGRQMFLWWDRPLTPHQKERTSSNRYLITELEQRRLLGCRIGVAGLSTGSLAVEVMMREGIGGVYRLADFDVFEMKNANRMFYGIEDVGKSKLDLVTARIRSIDPAVHVEPFASGVTHETVADFVRGCDIIVEECDDIAVKALIRQAAQKAGVPLVMGTSQNGMIDVERYDIDSACRPFFLDVLPELLNRGPNDPPLTAAEKREVVPVLFDSSQLSARFVQSNAEIGISISSWPQLAEEVALNTATLVHASRRILLGDECLVSGRFSVRMDRLFTAENRIITAKM